MRPTAVCWTFKTEKQLAGGTCREEKSKGRKDIYTSLFIAISPIGRTFCWGGDVCQGLLIQFVPPILFLNLSADFIPGMLQDQCGQEWANRLQKSLQVERDPLKVSQCTSVECYLGVTKESMVRVWEALRGNPTLRHHRTHTPSAKASS